MKNKKTIWFAAVFMLAAMNVGSTFAQQSTVTFAYDAAGNRISRTILLSSSNAPLRSTQDEAETTQLVEQLTGEVQVTIYPNPTQGHLQVEITGLEEQSQPAIAIFNMKGEKLQSLKAESLTQVNMSAYAAGVYILQLIINGQTTDYKIIKN